METGMHTYLKAAAVAVVIGGAVGFAMPSDAQVGVGVRVGGVHLGVHTPAPAYYYGPGYYPPGPCGSYNYYYNGDCGYPVYTGDVAFGGVTVGGPHYYRWNNNRPEFWYRGGWHNDWNGWRGRNYRWEHRGWRR
jgi:hypothetical protein